MKIILMFKVFLIAAFINAMKGMVFRHEQRTWTMEPIGVEWEITDEELVKVDMKVQRINRTSFAFDGTIEIFYEFDESTMLSHIERYLWSASIRTTALVEVNTDGWQERFFALTLFIVIILNVWSATMFGGVFGVAGLFPSEYMTTMVSGQVIGGILTALTFIIVLALGAGDPTITAFTFFIVGSVLILLNIVCYAIMENKPFFQYYLDVEENIRAPYMVNGVIGEDTAVQLCVKTVLSKIYVHAVTVCILFNSIGLSVHNFLIYLIYIY
uniref:Uncharacterized protein n=1 Tax=Glossina morsitans morsitans TaxID=37546 RepID=A0A1B0FQA4_GLOMM